MRMCNESSIPFRLIDYNKYLRNFETFNYKNADIHYMQGLCICDLLIECLSNMMLGAFMRSSNECYRLSNSQMPAYFLLLSFLCVMSYVISKAHNHVLCQAITPRQCLPSIFWSSGIELFMRVSLTPGIYHAPFDNRAILAYFICSLVTNWHCPLVMSIVYVGLD